MMDFLPRLLITLVSCFLLAVCPVPNQPLGVVAVGASVLNQPETPNAIVPRTPVSEKGHPSSTQQGDIATTAAAAAGATATAATAAAAPRSDGHGTLKVLNLNTWGLNWPWSKDRSHRYRALREILSLSDYDVILLQEVWNRQDYDTIRRSKPYVTHFESFNAGCSGFFLPLECSGLTILSRHPIESVEFRPFKYRGSFWDFDGEIFVNKGVARARVRWRGLSVDVFTTHMVSYTNNPNSDNSHYRFLQSVETARYVRQSDADIKLFGGDLNALPLHGHKQPYGILRTVLSDALTDRYPDASFHPWFATFGNKRNTYTGGACPERIDYLMFASRPGLRMRTSEFIMPMFMTRSGQGKLISLSDHEALHAEFTVELEHRYDDRGDFENGVRHHNNETDIAVT